MHNVLVQFFFAFFCSVSFSFLNFCFFPLLPVCSFAPDDMRAGGSRTPRGRRIMHPAVVNELNPQDIANTVWALATLHTTNNKLIDVLTQRALVPSVLNQFNSRPGLPLGGWGGGGDLFCWAGSAGGSSTNFGRGDISRLFNLCRFDSWIFFAFSELSPPF